MTETKRFLNVKFGDRTTEIDINGLLRFGQLQKELAAALIDGLVSFARVQLWNLNVDPPACLDDVDDMTALPDEYYLKAKLSGALVLTVKLLPSSKILTYSDQTEPHSFAALKHNVLGYPTDEGLPSSYVTQRVETVNAIFDTLFPSVKGKYRPLLLFKAPPLSGKTSMSMLLHQKLLEFRIPTIALSALRLRSDESVESWLEREMPGFSCAEYFQKETRPRVLIIDEAQCTYRDGMFWRSYIKELLQIPGNRGLRIVMFSSYGSFDPYRSATIHGTPITVPRNSIMGLENDEENPGLYLSKAEFKEMIKGTVVELIDGLAWNFCGRHLGIAFHVIGFICEKFKKSNREDIRPSDLEALLRSQELLRYIISYCPGVPTIRTFNTLLNVYEVTPVVREKMERILEIAASAKAISTIPQAGSPGSIEAVEILTKAGLLYEDRDGWLHFASTMHLKVWLFSTRTDPLVHLMNNPGLEDFLIASIKRMRSQNLSRIAAENNDIMRERQLQMEFYHSLISCVPKSVLITPEWRTRDKDGYVDIVLSGEGLSWFLELLVDGDDAAGHENKFKADNAYHSSLLPYSRYVLIDFRQNRSSIRKFRDHFMYVVFESNYTSATLVKENKETVQVQLSL